MKSLALCEQIWPKKERNLKKSKKKSKVLKECSEKRKNLNRAYSNRLMGAIRNWIEPTRLSRVLRVKRLDGLQRLLVWIRSMVC